MNVSYQSMTLNVSFSPKFDFFLEKYTSILCNNIVEMAFKKNYILSKCTVVCTLDYCRKWSEKVRNLYKLLLPVTAMSSGFG